MTAATQFLTPVLARLAWISLQACVIVGLILIVQAVLGDRLAPRWRYALWFLLAVRLAIPWAPASSLSVYNLFPRDLWFVQSTSAEARAPVAKAVPPSLGVGEGNSPVDLPSPTGEDAPGPRRQPLPWLLLAWAGGFGVFLAGTLFQAFRLSSSVRRRRAVTDQATLDLLEDCKELMCVRAWLAVVETAEVKGPALFGFIRPKLLLPEGAIRELGPERLRHVLLHELAHLKRGDIAVNWLMTILQAIHWFNPLVWYGFSRMRADRELACDALALARLNPEEAHAYGQTIIHLLEHFAEASPTPALAGILESKSQMKRRIAMIAHQGRRPTGWSIATLCLLIGMGCVALTSAKHGSPRPTPNIQVESVEESFANLNHCDEFYTLTSFSESLPAGPLDTMRRITSNPRFGKIYSDLFAMDPAARSRLLTKWFHAMIADYCSQVELYRHGSEADCVKINSQIMRLNEIDGAPQSMTGNIHAIQALGLMVGLFGDKAAWPLVKNALLHPKYGMDVDEADFSSLFCKSFDHNFVFPESFVAQVVYQMKTHSDLPGSDIVSSFPPLVVSAVNSGSEQVSWFPPELCGGKSEEGSDSGQSPRFLQTATSSAQAAKAEIGGGLAFEDDPAVIGHWVSVDFVQNIEDFKPRQKSWSGNMYLKEMTFLPQGVSLGPWTWTKGKLWHPGDQTVARYWIKQMDGAAYLFMEWISGDVTPRGMKPRYCVLKRDPSYIAPAEPKPGDSTFGKSTPNQKADLVKIGKSTLDDMIRIFGEPSGYLWRDKDGLHHYTKEQLPETFCADYPNNFSALISNKVVGEIRFEGPTEYRFRNAITVGTPLEDVLKTLGQPTSTVTGKNAFQDGILYKDIDGAKGRCYYARPDQGIRMFFLEDKVCALYLTAISDNKVFPSAQQAAQITLGKSMLADVVRVFGEPNRYVRGNQTLSKDNLPPAYYMEYPGNFGVWMVDGVATELRHHRAGYRLACRVGAGSALDEVIKAVGQPTAIVEGQPNAFKDGVLYKDIDGEKGNDYYSRPDQGVRFFFFNDAVSEMNETAKKPLTGQ